MSSAAELAAHRRAQAAWVAALAVLLALGAWLALGRQPGGKPPESPGLAAPDFAARQADARLIVISTSTQTYRIARTAKGWAMKDRGDYPVRRDRLAQFSEGLAKLTLDRAMTRDPKKHDRLGLGDPAKGGQGIAVQVQDAQGALLANLVLGVSPGALYVRSAASDQTWTAKGELPPLREAGQWLDLALVEIPEARIARVDVAPASGPGYAILRSEPGGAFTVGRPFAQYPPTAPPGAVATALGRLSPIDVTAAPAIAGAPAARAVLRTFDGLVVAGELFVQGDKRWLKIGARSEQAEGPAVEDAARINKTSGPWAYGLTQGDFDMIAPPLDAIVRRPQAPAAVSAAPPPASPG